MSKSQGNPIHHRKRHIIMRATPSGWPCQITRSPGCSVSASSRRKPAENGVDRNSSMSMGLLSRRRRKSFGVRNGVAIRFSRMQSSSLFRRANQSNCVNPHSQKYTSGYSVNQNYKLDRLIPEEGRWPSSPNVGMRCGDAVSCTGRSTVRVRRSRVVLAPRCWRQALEASFLRDDGDKSPLTGEQLCCEIDRRSVGLKAGAAAPPPSAADGLDPVRSPVRRLCKRSAETRVQGFRSVSSLHTDWHPISRGGRSWC